jgi:hypothetical protein
MTDRLLDAITAIGVIRPGDVLLLSTEQQLTHEQASMIKRSVMDVMPGIEVVVASGLHATVLRDEGTPVPAELEANELEFRAELLAGWVDADGMFRPAG